MTIVDFEAADSEKSCNPVVIWQSQLQHCFRKLTVPTRPAGLHYFASAKSWMNTEIMEHILGRLDRQLKLENFHVILFFDNALNHPEFLQDPLELMKLVFFPKNKTSELQPAEAGIICNLKARYRKCLVRHVSILNGENTASTIIKQVTVLDAIR